MQINSTYRAFIILMVVLGTSSITYSKGEDKPNIPWITTEDMGFGNYLVGNT